MINPALFIGLGSTGLKILDKLQGLVLEEYGVSSLPIFSYIAIVIEEDDSTVQQVKKNPDNEIIFFHPTITSTDAVGRAIEQGERKYYDDWLDKTVLNISGGKIKGGAGNVRMAGRLCLWENWKSLASDEQKPGCAKTLQSAYDVITAGENRTKTTQILNKIYNDWGKAVPEVGINIDPNPNVYIVGTLCGGTASGMFIDIAYYVKHIFGLWKKNIGGDRAKVIGVFTIYDSKKLNVADSDLPRRHAANCWASLLEYDYYCHRISRYQTRFPCGTYIDTNEEPLDHLYLLSCKGNGTDLHKGKGGEPDEGSLANMAAMVLFSETVEGLLGEKERIRIDSLTNPRALTPNKNQHMASINTCGFATFRYPKYRIVEVASCKYAVDLCQKWTGAEPGKDQVTSITKEANSIWNTIKATTRDILIHSPTGLLTDEVRAWFDAESPEEIIKTIRDELEKFGEGKKYDKHICARHKELIEGIKEGDKIVREGILNLINDEVIKKLNEKQNIAHVREFITQIDKAIENTIKNEEPKKYPAPNISKATIDLTPDFWIKSVGKAKDVSKEKKEDYLEETKEEFISQIERIRDYRIKSVLEEIRQEIGVEQQPPEEWIRAGKRSIKQELDNREDILSACLKDFQNKAEKMCIEPERTQDVIIITKAKDMSEDIENLYSTLKTQADSDAMLKKARRKEIGGQQVEIDFPKWLGYGEPMRDKGDLAKSILDAVREEALKRREKFIIAAEVLRRARALNVNLCQFVENSLPHLELAGNLASISVGNPHEFVSGKDEDINAKNIKNLHDTLIKSCPNPVVFGEKFLKHMDELDHLLLFYKEESLIYMDENLSTAELFAKRYRDYENYLKTVRKEEASSRTVHTHSLGGFFDVWIPIRREEASRLMQIVQEIFSTRDEKGDWKDSEIFNVGKKSLVLRFKLPNGKDEVIEGNARGIERLAQNKDSFIYFENLVKEKAKEVGRKGFIERVNNLADWFEKDADSKGDPNSIQAGNRKRDEYLNKQNPDRLIKICFPEEDEREKENE